MIILIPISILIFSILELNFEARWDAEAFKEGESNHLYKTLMLISWGLIIIATFFIGFHCGILYFKLKTAIAVIMLCVLIYPCVRWAVFDNLLNHFRKKPKDYKTDIVMQWLSGITALIILTILFIIL